MGLETKTISLQRDGATASKRIQHDREPATAGFLHLKAGLGIDLGPCVEFLLHHLAENAKEPFSFCVLRRLGGELIEMFGFVIEDTPDPARLLLPDDWPDGVYPLRKAFEGLGA